MDNLLEFIFIVVFVLGNIAYRVYKSREGQDAPSSADDDKRMFENAQRKRALENAAKKRVRQQQSATSPKRADSKTLNKNFLDTLLDDYAKLQNKKSADNPYEASVQNDNLRPPVESEYGAAEDEIILEDCVENEDAGSVGILKFFKNSEDLKSAFVISEIVDKPLSLRERKTYF